MTTNERTTEAPAKFLTREEILAKAIATHPPIPVDVPEWGGQVYVRRLSVGDVANYHQRIQAADAAKVNAVALSLAVCDEQGKQLCSEADLAWIDDLPSSAFQKIMTEFFAANRIGGLGVRSTK